MASLPPSSSSFSPDHMKHCALHTPYLNLLYTLLTLTLHSIVSSSAALLQLHLSPVHPIQREQGVTLRLAKATQYNSPIAHGSYTNMDWTDFASTLRLLPFILNPPLSHTVPTYKPTLRRSQRKQLHLPISHLPKPIQYSRRYSVRRLKLESV